jgi:hypothetical protein
MWSSAAFALRAPGPPRRDLASDRELVPFNGFDGIVDALARDLERLPRDEAALFPVLSRAPGFGRGKDVRAARAALKRYDYHALWVLGHTMRGLGASYGFDGITEIGAALEKAALGHHDAAIGHAVDALESYLGRVEYCVAS